MSNEIPTIRWIELTGAGVKKPSLNAALKFLGELRETHSRGLSASMDMNLRWRQNCIEKGARGLFTELYCSQSSIATVAR